MIISSHSVACGLKCFTCGGTFSNILHLILVSSFVSTTILHTFTFFPLGALAWASSPGKLYDGTMRVGFVVLHKRDLWLAKGTSFHAPVSKYASLGLAFKYFALGYGACQRCTISHTRQETSDGFRKATDGGLHVTQSF